MSGSLSPIVRCNPTIDTAIYADGDIIASFTVVHPFGDPKTGILKSLVVKDNDNEKAAMTLLLFDQQPGNTQAVNAAYTWATGDFAKCIGRVQVAAADYKTINGKAIAEIAVSKNVQDNTAANDKGAMSRLYVIAVTDGSTPTYTNATDLEFQLGFLSDG